MFFAICSHKFQNFLTKDTLFRRGLLLCNADSTLTVTCERFADELFGLLVVVEKVNRAAKQLLSCSIALEARTTKKSPTKALAVFGIYECWICDACMKRSCFMFVTSAALSLMPCEFRSRNLNMGKNRHLH